MHIYSKNVEKMSKKRNTNAKPQRIKKNALSNLVLEAMQETPNKPYNYKQLARQLGLNTPPEKQLLITVLDELVLQEMILEISIGRYKINTRGGYVEGIIDRQSNGKNFLIPDDGADPIFIAERRLRQAMNKDRVKVFLYANRPGTQPEGEVVEILQRAQETFVGILQVSKNYAFLRVDNRILTNDIFIPSEKLNGGRDGLKAIVKITGWNEGERNPIGEVVDVLGAVGDNNTEMHAILAEFGLPYKYPKDVEDAAALISEKISAEEIAKRKDMRAVPTFTIDPKDAKDFDDALSIEKLPNGLWEIGVHIADVTHYVKPNSIIEEEAYKRATSVYLVDRTIPMLPEHLSNKLCSLRPNEEKLCFSVLFHIDDEAQVKHYEICRTIILSDRRFTYEEAQNVIETGEGDMRDEILVLDKLAKIIRQERFSKGSIAFDRVEVRFDIDEKGKPLSVYFKEAKDANKLIEEFMLLANKTVATHVGKPGKGKKAKTFVYRIHDVPNPDKLKTFADFIRKFGYSLKTSGKQTEVSTSINKLLDEVQGKKEQNLIETIAIRSMAKAVYSTVNVGHYGLAFNFYSHFTSPIRRYPDMMVHRLLEKYLAEGKSVSAELYEEKCEHSSNMEQVAANAERASIKYKQVEFMTERVGVIFDGVISGIQEWGIYVELNENKCEGMIPIRDLDNDYYSFDEKNYCLIGRRTRRKFQLGDEITVKVVKANLEKKQLDFVLADKF